MGRKNSISEVAKGEDKDVLFQEGKNSLVLNSLPTQESPLDTPRSSRVTL